ncbi:MAG: segregation/condensation protein A [Candidatus Ranarchaeia archaeon]
MPPPSKPKNKNGDVVGEGQPADSLSQSKQELQQPFYTRFPWVILTNPIETKSAKPLEVEISEILPSFFIKMKEKGQIDLRLSGRALYSASLIYRLQTDSLIKLINALDAILEQESPEKIPALKIPYRLSAKRVTMDELLVALAEVLSDAETKRFHLTPKPPKERYHLQLDYEPERVNIETLIGKIFNRIVELYKERNRVGFNDLLKNKQQIEIVRVFLALLYLLNRQKIDIIRDPKTNTILITVEDKSDELKE